MAVVIMRVSLVGPTVSASGGDRFPCDDATAQRLVESGAAEWPTDAPDVVEAAMVAPAAERAMKPKAKARL